MADLPTLRQRLGRRRAEAEHDVLKARADLESAQALLRRAEDNLAKITAEVERRMAAIQLVEEMSAEGGTDQHPYRTLTQEQAMKLALRKAEQSMNSTELAEALRLGGYPFRSANPTNSIVVAANNNRSGCFSTARDGNRTLIGLKEWGLEVMNAENPFDPWHDTPDPSDIGTEACR